MPWLESWRKLRALICSKIDQRICIRFFYTDLLRIASYTAAAYMTIN